MLFKGTQTSFRACFSVIFLLLFASFMGGGIDVLLMIRHVLETSWNSSDQRVVKYSITFTVDNKRSQLVLKVVFGECN